MKGSVGPPAACTARNPTGWQEAPSMSRRCKREMGHGGQQRRRGTRSRRGALPALAAAWSPKTIPSGTRRQVGGRERARRWEQQWVTPESTSHTSWAPPVSHSRDRAPGRPRSTPVLPLTPFQSCVSERDSRAQVGAQDRARQGPERAVRNCLGPGGAPSSRGACWRVPCSPWLALWPLPPAQTLTPSPAGHAGPEPRHLVASAGTTTQEWKEKGLRLETAAHSKRRHWPTTEVSPTTPRRRWLSGHLTAPATQPHPAWHPGCDGQGDGSSLPGPAQM